MRRLVVVLFILISVITGLAFLYSMKDVSGDYAALLQHHARGLRQQLVGLTSAAASWRPSRDTLPSADINAFMDRISSTYANARELFESPPDRYITAPIERGRFATVVRATGTLS